MQSAGTYYHTCFLRRSKLIIFPIYLSICVIYFDAVWRRIAPLVIEEYRIYRKRTNYLLGWHIVTSTYYNRYDTWYYIIFVVFDTIIIMDRDDDTPGAPLSIDKYTDDDIATSFFLFCLFFCFFVFFTP